MVVAKIDHKNMLSMVGANIRGSSTIEFGKPDMGKMLLPMNPAIGLEMPARVYVYESSDGRVTVSFRKVTPSAYGRQAALVFRPAVPAPVPSPGRHPRAGGLTTAAAFTPIPPPLPCLWASPS